MKPVTIPYPGQVTVLRKAALTAGIAILAMALTVPWVEFYIFPTLIDYRNAAQTTFNIEQNKSLFSLAIFIHLLTVIADIVSGWALYIFLKPVNKDLALLTAWFRLVNAAFTIVALHNLVQVVTLIKAKESFVAIAPVRVQEQVLFYVRAFNIQWRLMLVFFGIYMCLLSYLSLRAKYIPKIIGICILIAGAGYLIDDLKYFFYPTLNTDYLFFTYFGELVFMFWLLIKGARIKEIRT